MKPNFALNLSHDGIMLLHRASHGWHITGKVALDDPEMAAKLAELRERATTISTAGLATKLVIPDSQILYRDIPDPGPDGRDAAIRAALDGVTPYALDDLVWDSTVAGQRIQIAVLARETLDEAESFAMEHRFNPVSFIAMPEDGVFEGEPFFGRARNADTLIGAESVIEPDSKPIEILPQRAVPTAEPLIAPTDTLTEDTAGSTEEPQTLSPPLAEDETASATPVAQDSVLAETHPAEEDTAQREQSSPAELEKLPPESSEPIDVPTSTFHSRRQTESETPNAKADTTTAKATPILSAQPSRVLSAIAPSLGKETSTPEAETSDAGDVPGADASVESPPPSVTSAELPIEELEEAPKPKAPRPGKAAPLPEPPPMPAPIVPAKKVEPQVGKARNGAGALGKLKSLSPLAAKSTEKPAAKVASKPVASTEDIVKAPLPKTSSAAGEDMSPLSDRAAGLDRVENTEDEAEALTVFGARRRNREARNKPRHFGLKLTGGLVVLLLLAGLAAGLLPDGDTSDAPPVVEDTQSSSIVPAPGTEETSTESALLPETDTSTDETDVAQLESNAEDEEAELTPELLEQATVPAPPSEELAEEALDTEALAARYAATGIWPLAPVSGAGESVEDDLNALYTASIDHNIASQDAVALPEASRHVGETAPRAPLPPAPLGTRYDYDEDGFIRATPDGTVMPDGAVVYAGRPAATPKPRPGSAVDEAVESALAPARQNEDDPQFLALAKFQPKLRPESLVENNEKANLGGLTRAELGRIKPQPRPASAQELAAEEARSSGAVQADRTAPVVTVSLIPKARPQNFEKLASAARAAEAAAAAAADAGTTRSSAAEKVTARVPESTIPKSGPANVARAATVNNAINLRKLNLMGVYGSSSDRRALVRLPSGRFAKVKVGDKLDGGQVQSISSDSLTYVKRGRAITIEIGG